MTPASPATLLDVLRGHAQKHGQQTALIMDKTVTRYRDLWHEIESFSRLLRQSGLSRGDRVILVLPNSLEFFVAFYGVLLAGGIAVPLFADSGKTRQEKFQALSGATAIVSGNSALDCGPALFSKKAWRQGIYVYRRNEVQERTADGPAVRPVVATDIAYIQYTSGSTGAPKGVIISHGDLMTNIRQMIDGFRINRGDVFVSWLPCCHDMGLILMTMVPFVLTCPLILLRSNMHGILDWLHAIHHYRGTFTAAPDFAYRLCLIYVREPNRLDLSCLRVAVNAAEPVRSSTIQRFEKQFKLNSVLTPAYGLAEATVAVSHWPTGTPIRTDARGFVSVGTGFPGVTLRIIKGRKSAATGDIGEIQISSPANTSGYWGNRKESRRLFSADGFMKTGDMGYLDEHNHLYVVGRRKNLIIQAGINIAPQEVEERIDSLRLVRSSAAVGIDEGTRAGEQVFIFVEVKLRPGDEKDKLYRLALTVSRRFKKHFGFAPGRILLVKTGTVPKTRNSKIRYTELKKRYLSGWYSRHRAILYPEYG